MTTVTIDEKYVETIKPFIDIQSAMNIAMQRYVIDLISAKISKLSKKNKDYMLKYNSNFDTFSNKIINDEKYISHLEQQSGFKNWENDLLDWEFNYKGKSDWKQK